MKETDPNRPPAGPWLRAAYRRLLAAYGPQHWWPAQGPLEIIVGAVLTQNTSWRGVERAIANLRSARLLSLSALLRLGQEEMARHIRPAGCPNVKTRRLANLLALVRSRGGIAGLCRLPTPPPAGRTAGGKRRRPGNHGLDTALRAGPAGIRY